MNLEIQSKISFFGYAVSRLREAVVHKSLVDDSFIRDSIEQRFKFSFELAWQTLKKVLQYDGITTTTPRETLVYAFRAHLIDSEKLWLEMLDSRNQMANLYNEQASIEIAERGKSFLVEFEKLVKKLTEKLETQT